MLKNKIMRTLLVVVLTLVLTVPSFAQESKTTQTETQTETQTTGTNTQSSEEILFIGDFDEYVTAHTVTPVALHTESVTYKHEGARFGELLVSNYSYVEAGQVLATFIPDNSASAMEEAKRNLEREKEAYQIELSSQYEAIEEAKANRNQLTNTLDIELADLQINRLWTKLEQYKNSEEYQISLLEKKVSDLEEEYAQDSLIAPISGMVDTGNAPFLREGDLAEELTMYIYDIDSVRLVSEQLDGFYYGQEVELEYGFTNSRETMKGTVTATSELVSEMDVDLTDGISNLEADQVVIIGLPGVDMKEFYTQYRVRNSAYSANLTAKVCSKHIADCLMLAKEYRQTENEKTYCMIEDEGGKRKQFFTCGGVNSVGAWVLAGLDFSMNIVK